MIAKYVIILFFLFVIGDFTGETAHRRLGCVKLYLSNKYPIKCTDFFDVAVANTINGISDLTSQSKSSPQIWQVLHQSVDLWNFTVIFYGRNRVLHSVKIKDPYIIHLCDKFNLLYPLSLVFHLKNDEFLHNTGRYARSSTYTRVPYKNPLRS